jgi:hypothetical protein
MAAQHCDCGCDRNSYVFCVTVTQRVIGALQGCQEIVAGPCRRLATREGSVLGPQGTWEWRKRHGLYWRAEGSTAWWGEQFYRLGWCWVLEQTQESRLQTVWEGSAPLPGTHPQRPPNFPKGSLALLSESLPFLHCQGHTQRAVLAH